MALNSIIIVMVVVVVYNLFTCGGGVKRAYFKKLLDTCEYMVV